MEARIGRLPTSTKIGLVWAEPSMRNEIQLLCSMGTSNAKSRIEPSAIKLWLATERPLTTTSTVTLRDPVTRACSGVQKGC